VDKKAKKRVRGVAIFLVFLAMAITIGVEYKSDRSPDNGKADLKSYQTEFKNHRWLYKASFELSSASLEDAVLKMNKLVDKFQQQHIKRVKGPNHGVYIFSLDNTKVSSFKKSLAEVGNIGTQIETVDTSLVNTNYENETANLSSYEKEFQELEKIRVPSDVERRSKEALRAKIKLTLQKLDDLRRGDSYLVYVSILPTPKNSNMMTTIRRMVVNFLKYLVFCFVGLVLVYFGTRLLMFLLAMMGVKGLGMSGVGGAYQYGGYSGYASKYYSRYGYGRSRRKTKRIYKEKESSSEPKDNGPE